MECWFPLSTQVYLVNLTFRGPRNLSVNAVFVLINISLHMLHIILSRIFSENLCTRHCARFWVYSAEQKNDSSFLHEAHSQSLLELLPEPSCPESRG